MEWRSSDVNGPPAQGPSSLVDAPFEHLLPRWRLNAFAQYSPTRVAAAGMMTLARSRTVSTRAFRGYSRAVEAEPPAALSSAAAAVRLATPSLRKTRSRCLATVAGAIPSSNPIASFS